MSECSARTWFPVSSFQRSFRFLTLSFVIRVSFRFQPVRSLSPPSVSQSWSAAPPVCALTIDGCGRRPVPHARPQLTAAAVRNMIFFIVDLARSPVAFNHQ